MMLEPTPWDRHQMLLRLEKQFAIFEVQCVLEKAAEEEREARRPMRIILVDRKLHEVRFAVVAKEIRRWCSDVPNNSMFQYLSVELAEFTMFSNGDLYLWTAPKDKKEAQKCLDANVSIPYSAPVYKPVDIFF